MTPLTLLPGGDRLGAEMEQVHEQERWVMRRTRLVWLFIVPSSMVQPAVFSNGHDSSMAFLDEFDEGG